MYENETAEFERSTSNEGLIARAEQLEANRCPVTDPFVPDLEARCEWEAGHQGQHRTIRPNGDVSTWVGEGPNPGGPYDSKIGTTVGLAARSASWEHLRSEQVYVRVQTDPGSHPVEVDAWVGYDSIARFRLTPAQARELSAVLLEAAEVVEPGPSGPVERQPHDRRRNDRRGADRAVHYSGESVLAAARAAVLNPDPEAAQGALASAVEVWEAAIDARRMSR